MNTMDSIMDLGESLNNWLKSGMGGQEPSESLLQAFWTLTDLDMQNGTKGEVERLRAVMGSLVAALPADTPGPVMATARRATAAVQEFTPKGASSVGVLCLIAGFRVLQITALQAVYRAMQSPGADLTAHLEGV